MFEVRGLCKGYGESGNYTVEGINLQINKGSIHGLIGHNGSGKTTIIKCLTGIYKPDQGTVTLMVNQYMKIRQLKKRLVMWQTAIICLAVIK